MTRLVFATALASLMLAPAATPVAARHRHGARVELPPGASRGGLPPGRYTIKILAPTLGPAMTIDEQVFSICYSAADAAAHRNPIMPETERKACQQESMSLGGDFAYDDYCADGQHRLRINPINEASYGGTYRFLAKGKDGLLLEPAVQLHREGDCPS